MNDYENAGYDEWLDAVADGEPYYLRCENGHGSLPPRQVCPDCASPELTETDLSPTGTVETVSVTTVPTPDFEEDAPFAVAIVDFGPVRVTGQVVGSKPDAVDPGLPVTLDVGVTATTGDRILQFRPAEID